jgi:hypothetical protein
MGRFAIETWRAGAGSSLVWVLRRDGVTCSRNRWLLGDEVLPREPLRQWVLSVPFALRYRFAVNPAMTGQLLGIVYRAISSHLINAAG